MRLIKAIFLAVTLMLSATAFALTDDEQVALADAIEKGDTVVVKQFIDSGLNVKETTFAWTWLQVAANKNHLGIVKLFVDAGSDLNYKHPMTKMTALSFAAYNNNKDIAQYLISKGADPNIHMRGNVSIVRMARDMGNTDMVEFLMQNGAKDDGCKEEKCF